MGKWADESFRAWAEHSVLEQLGYKRDRHSKHRELVLAATFMACHNAIWEHAERLLNAEQNPDHLAVEAIAAELTNHLIPNVVLTPGIVATLVKLQRSGFAYAR